MELKYFRRGNYDISHKSLYQKLSILHSVIPLLLLLGFISTVKADILYSYDASNRLVGVSSDKGDNALYVYDAASNLTAIQRITQAQLSITSLVPVAASINSTVTIHGSGFSKVLSNNKVNFNGVEAIVKTATVDQLVVIVPENARSGPVTVTVGSFFTVSARAFTVTDSVAESAPKITSFTPTTDIVGSTLTINGQNFAAGISHVTINNVYAPIKSFNATQVVVTIPPQATSGPVKVKTAFGETISSDNFIIPPKGYNTSQIGVTGPLLINGPIATFNNLNADGKIAIILFDGKKGQNLGLGITPVTFSSGKSSSIYINTPSGKELLSKSLSGKSKFTVPTLPEDGSYSMIVIPSTATTVFNASFTLSDNVSGTLNQDGTPLSFMTSRSGQNARYSFNGNAGDNMNLVWSDTTFADGYLYILKPDGSRLTYSTINNGYYKSDIITLLNLPVTGTYSAFIEPYDTNAGSINLKLMADASDTIPVNGTQLNISLMAGQRGNYSFIGQQGQRLTLGITNFATTQTYGNVKIEVMGSNGKVIYNCGTFRDNNKCTLPALPNDDTYYLRIATGGIYEVSATLSLSSEITGTLVPNSPAQIINIARPGQDARYTFNGKQGQRLSLGINNFKADKSYDYVSIKILGANEQLIHNCGSFSYNNKCTLPVLPADGTYLVQLSTGGSYGVSATLSLSTEITGTLSVDGAAQTITLSQVGQNGRYTFSGQVGENINLAWSNTTLADGYLYILKPDGSQLTYDSFNNGYYKNYLFKLPSLPMTGTYTVFIDPYRTSTGSINLQLMRR